MLRPRVCANLGCNGSKVMKITTQMADCLNTLLSDRFLFHSFVVWACVIVLALPPSISALQCGEPGFFSVLKLIDGFCIAKSVSLGVVG